MTLNIRGRHTEEPLEIVGHDRPIIVPFVRYCQEEKYGERTARGTAGGNKVCWALALGETRRVRSSKRSDIVIDIASFRASAPGKKPDRRGVDDSKSGAGRLKGSGLQGKGWKFCDTCEILTRPINQHKLTRQPAIAPSPIAGTRRNVGNFSISLQSYHLPPFPSSLSDNDASQSN
jgi:hypothetical protein